MTNFGFISASFVGNSPLKLMNEDTFLVVLKDLSVSDYVHLTMLCRTFNQLFGSVRKIQKNRSIFAN